MLVSDKSRLKQNVEDMGFQLALKTIERVSADLTDSGRLFHTVGPATEKARSPNSKPAVYLVDSPAGN